MVDVVIPHDVHSSILYIPDPNYKIQLDYV
jgi:hypothetical protein